MALTSALTCETKLGEYTFGRGLVSMLHRQTGCRSISTMSLKVAVITKVMVAHLTCGGSSERARRGSRVTQGAVSLIVLVVSLIF